MSSSGSGWPLGGAEGDEPGAAGYEWSESSSRPGGPYGEGQDDEYGRGAGRSGRHSALSPYGGANSGREGYGGDYRQDWPEGGGYAEDQSGRGHYDAGSGQGWYGHEAPGGPYGDPRYGADGGDRDGYDRDGYGQGGYERDGYGHGDYSRGSYGQDQYGHDGYGRGGGQAGYGGEYYEQAPYRDDEFGRGGYRREAYEQESYGYGPGAGDHDASPNYGSNGRSFDAHDGGWSDQPDTGTYGAPDGYQQTTEQSSYGLPDATVRRAEIGGPARGAGDDGGYGQWQEAHDDADSWHGDQPEDDWRDDRSRDGLLSSQFSRASSSRSAGRRAGRAKRQRRVRGKFATVAAILAGALVLGAVADYGYEKYKTWHTDRYGDYAGAGFGKVDFTVNAGSSLQGLGPALQKAGVIMELRPYDSAAAAASNASGLQPGVYLLHKHMSSALAVTWLLSSKHRTSRGGVTIIEGLRGSQIALILAKQTGLPASQFTQIINHPPASLGLPSWAPAGKSAEGFLFPDTYTLAPKMTALKILQMMVTEFKRQIAAINLVGQAHKVFTTPWHALIVGSLIQAEAGSTSDFGKISRVVWRRLGQGMKLQFDSTIFYAMHSYGTYANSTQRNFPSPYNTYLHAGLPPGPIGNPGIAAINAAVHATQGPWLYFITDTRHKPYKTYFTASYSQFQRWQQEFQG